MSIIWERLKNLKSWFVIGLLVLIITGLVKSLIDFSTTRDRFVEAEKEVQELEREKEELQSQLTLEDEEYVTEKELRDALGLSRPGEVVVVIPEDLLEETLSQRQELKQLNIDQTNWQKWIQLFRE